MDALTLAITFGCPTNTLAGILEVTWTIFVYGAVAIVVLKVSAFVSWAGLNPSLTRTPYAIVTLLTTLDTRTYADATTSRLAGLALTILVDGTVAVVVEVVVANVYDLVGGWGLTNALVVDQAFVAFSLVAVRVQARTTFVDDTVAVFISRFISIATFGFWADSTNARTPKPLCSTEFVSFLAGADPRRSFGKGVAS